MILDWLKLPGTNKDVDLDDPATTALHAQIIRQKPFLKNIYLDFYNQFAARLQGREGGCVVELGSGGGFIKEVLPQTVTSDIIPLENIDICFSGEAIPLKDGTVDAFVMINVLHHVKNPGGFLNEMARCLKGGGRIVMVEPASTAWGKFIYRKFHHEGFDETAGWEIKGEGPLSEANIAMPWIIFCRDRQKFENEFPCFKIVGMKYHTPFRYLISGGFKLRQLLPSFCYPLVLFLEYLLAPFQKLLGLFFSIEIIKTG